MVTQDRINVYKSCVPWRVGTVITFEQATGIFGVGQFVPGIPVQIRIAGSGAYWILGQPTTDSGVIHGRSPFFRGRVGSSVRRREWTVVFAALRLQCSKAT